VTDESPLTPIAGLRAVLFDLDGTLADSEPLIAQAVSESAAAFGYELSSGDVIPRIGPPMPIMLQQMLPIGPDEAQTIYEEYQRRYNSRFVPQTQPLPGAVELLASLRARDVAMAVVTNKNEFGGKVLVEAMGWTSLFRVVVGMDTAGAGKPAPDGILHALGVVGAGPDETAFVGDSSADMGGGRAAKTRAVIGITGLRSAEEMLEGGGAHTADDLAGVATLLSEARGP